MKVKHKTTGEVGSSSRLNPHGLGEIIVYFEEGDCTSDFSQDYQFYLESSKEWVDFGDKRIVSHNNLEFREARSQQEIEQGFY